MAITRTLLTGSFSTANAGSYDTASVTPTATTLVLAAVCVVDGNGAGTIATTGNGLTWVEITTKLILAFGDNQRISVFRAMGASPSAGAITFTITGGSPNGCSWSVVEFPGTDTSGTNGSGAIVQSATGGATTGTTFSAALASFGDATNNVAYGAFAHYNENEALTVGAGFASLHDITNNDATYLHDFGTEWKTGEDTLVDMTALTSDPWAGIAIEIKAAAGGGDGTDMPWPDFPGPINTPIPVIGVG